MSWSWSRPSTRSSLGSNPRPEDEANPMCSPSASPLHVFRPAVCVVLAMSSFEPRQRAARGWPSTWFSPCLLLIYCCLLISQACSSSALLQGSGSQGGLILLSTGGTIKLCSIGSTSLPSSLFEERKHRFSRIAALDYYYDDGHNLIVLWVDLKGNESRLFSARLGVADKKLLDIEPFQVNANNSLGSQIRGLAIDRVNQVAYISLPQLGRIDAIDLRSACVCNLFEGLTNPSQVAIDASSGLLVWIENGACIWKSGAEGGYKEMVTCLDGSNEKHEEGHLKIKSLTTHQWYVYWILSNGAVFRKHLKGEQTPETVISNLFPYLKYYTLSPYSISVSNSNDPRNELTVYISDALHGTLSYSKVGDKRGEETPFPMDKKRSDVILVEQVVYDFKLIGGRSSLRRELSNGSTDLGANESLTCLKVTNESSSQITRCVHYKGSNFGDLSSQVKTGLLSPETSDDTSDRIVWHLSDFWMYVIFGGLTAVLVLFVSGSFVALLAKRRRKLLTLLEDAEATRSRSTSASSSRSARSELLNVNSLKRSRMSQKAMNVTRVGPRNTICIEDLGGFSNAGFSDPSCSRCPYKNDSGSCDFKEECVEKGICLSTYRPLFNRSN